MTMPQIKSLLEVAGNLSLATSRTGFRDVTAGEVFDLTVTMTNTADSALTWDSDEFLNLSYRWFDPETWEVLVQDGPRTSVGGYFHPKESRVVRLNARVPNSIGNAVLRISFLYENRFWFFDDLKTGWEDIAVSIGPTAGWPDIFDGSKAARAFRGSVAALDLKRQIEGIKSAATDPIAYESPAPQPLQAMPEIAPPAPQRTDPVVAADSSLVLSELKAAFHASSEEQIDPAQHVVSEQYGSAEPSSARSLTYWQRVGKQFEAMLHPMRTWERVHDGWLQRSHLGRTVSEMHQEILELSKGQAAALRLASHDRQLLLLSAESIVASQVRHADASREMVESLSRKMDALGQETSSVLARCDETLISVETRADSLQVDIRHTGTLVSALSREVALVYQAARTTADELARVAQTQRRALRVSRMTAQLVADFVRQSEDLRSVPVELSNMAAALSNLHGLQLDNMKLSSSLQSSLLTLPGRLDVLATAVAQLETGSNADKLDVIGLELKGLRALDLGGIFRAEITDVDRGQQELAKRIEALAQSLRETPDQVAGLHQKIDSLRPEIAVILSGLTQDITILIDVISELRSVDFSAGVRSDLVDISHEQLALNSLLRELGDSLLPISEQLVAIHDTIGGPDFGFAAAALEKDIDTIKSQISSASGDRAVFQAEVVSTLRQLLPVVINANAGIASLHHVNASADRSIPVSAENFATLLTETRTIASAASDLRLFIAESLNSLLVRQIFPIPALRIVICRSTIGFLALPDDDLEGLSYYSDGSVPESGTARVVEALLSEGDCFVDIGANVGLFSVVAGRRVGPRGKVIAFEPTPSTASAFQATMHLNGIADFVDLHEVAVSDQEGSALLNIGRTSGHNSLIALGGSTETIQVRTVKADDVLSGLAVHVIKIDVEGWELSVLNGLTETLAANPNVRIILEFGPLHLDRGGTSISAWVEQIEKTGLNAFEINEDDASITPLRAHGLNNIFSINILLTREVPNGLTLVPA